VTTDKQKMDYAETKEMIQKKEDVVFEERKELVIYKRKWFIQIGGK
jgi:hypothetical protein